MKWGTALASLIKSLEKTGLCGKGQARSQDFEKGRLFWKSETNVSDLDPNFHCSWIRFKRFIRNWWSRKKKRSSPKLRRIFRPKSEFQTVLPAESRQLLLNFGTQIPLGGAVSIFWAKIGLKGSKNIRFCILFSFQANFQPTPRPPFEYATGKGHKSPCLHCTILVIFCFFFKKIAIFVTFVRDFTQLNSQSNLKKKVP